MNTVLCIQNKKHSHLLQKNKRKAAPNAKYLTNIDHWSYISWVLLLLFFFSKRYQGEFFPANQPTRYDQETGHATLVI